MTTPCGLTQEKLDAHKWVNEEGECTAPFKNASGERQKGCGELYASHPSSAQVVVQRPRSPPYRASVYIFYVVSKNGMVRALGSAVAIDCTSKSILLTAGHCCFIRENRRYRNNLFCTLEMSKDDKGNCHLSDTSFPVSIVHCSKTPDIGILVRTDGIVFGRTVPLCPRNEVPWLLDPHGWECRVKCYHCPVDIFLTTDMPALSCNVTNYNAVAYRTDHHFAISEEFIGGSSGGAMILQEGHKLLGILITTAVTPITFDEPVDLIEASDKSSVSCSVLNPSMTYTTAVVPALLSFEHRGAKLSLPDFILSLGY